MTGRSFNFFAVILITLITFWMPLLPDVYSRITPDSTSTKLDSVDKRFNRDSMRVAPSSTDTSGQHLGESILIRKDTAFWLKVVGAVMIVALTIYSYYVKDYKPFLSYDELRKETLTHILKQIHEKMKAMGLDDLRFSVMQRRRWVRLTRFIQFGRLIPICHLGDAHMDRDKSLSYWYFKFFCKEFKQGVPGHAFLAEQDIFADMVSWRLKKHTQLTSTSPQANPQATPQTNPQANPQANPLKRMFGWLLDKNQLGLTNYRIELLSDLTIIMSVYMINWCGRSYRCTGVINIDTTNPETTRKMLDKTEGDKLKRALLNDHHQRWWIPKRLRP